MNSLIEKIKDIGNALNNKNFLSALALALTIPDICGKVEFPNDAGKENYIGWFDKYIYPYYQYNGQYAENYHGTEFDGKACYSLRCAFLHSGNTDIENKKLEVKINQFELCLSSTEDNGIYGDHFGVTTSNYLDTVDYSVRLDVRRLCKIICDAAEKYYQENDQRAFEDHTCHILNIEEESNRIKLLHTKD